MMSACTQPQADNVFDTSGMDALLSAAVDTRETLGVTAMVFKDGGRVYQNSFGVVDVDTQRPAAPDTVYRIYSMTKPITSAVIMSLVEEGKVTLSDPVSKYIPELANMQVASLSANGTPELKPQILPMTVEDLMLHRAGMGYGIYGPINPVEALWEKAGLFTPDEDLSVKMEKISKLPLVVQPGEGWYYSYSIDVLGHIAERVTGMRLSAIMQERIFTPLGMNETGFFVREDQAARFATNYTLHADGKFVLQDRASESPFLKAPKYQSGGGGLVSTMDDYAKFAQAMLQGGVLGDERILQEATVTTMMTNHLDDDDKYFFPWDRDGQIRFGYGGNVVVKDSPEGSFDGYSVGQWGWSGMARTHFFIDRPNKAFGIIMLQQFQAEDPALHDAFRAKAMQRSSAQ